MRVRELALAGVLAAVTAVFAQIAIPLEPVPFTFQVLAVALSGLVGGARVGFLTQLVYLMMGAAGLPVFANLSGGVGILAGPTGGYLFAFPFAAWVVGLVRGRGPDIARRFTAALAGIAVVYLFGATRLAMLFDMTPASAIAAGVTPFIAWDVLKCAIAAVASRGVERALRRDVEDALHDQAKHRGSHGRT